MKQKVEICGVDTSRLKRLSVKESEEMLMKIREGDKATRDEFILANVRLVLSIVKRFDKSKVSADDMFQAGMIGLIKSVDNFDLSVGVRFSTYAVPMTFVCRNGQKGIKITGCPFAATRFYVFFNFFRLSYRWKRFL